MSAHQQMNEALDEAEAHCRAVADAAFRMAKMLRGRLSAVPAFVLKDLKRELERFNMRTEEWKP